MGVLPETPPHPSESPGLEESGNAAQGHGQEAHWVKVRNGPILTLVTSYLSDLGTVPSHSYTSLNGTTELPLTWFSFF